MDPSALVIAVLCAAQAPAAPALVDGRVGSSACTRATLTSGAPCTVEGRGLSQPATRTMAKENHLIATALAEELCVTAAQGGELDPAPDVLRGCRARVAATTRACAGNGSRALTDEAGRFNPGFARCYAALAALVADASLDAENAAACCPCAAACGIAEGQCLDRARQGTLGACVAQRCSAACAPALLQSRAPRFEPARAP